MGYVRDSGRNRGGREDNWREVNNMTRDEYLDFLEEEYARRKANGEKVTHDKFYEGGYEYLPMPPSVRRQRERNARAENNKNDMWDRGSNQGSERGSERGLSRRSNQSPSRPLAAQERRELAYHRNQEAFRRQEAYFRRQRQAFCQEAEYEAACRQEAWNNLQAQNWQQQQVIQKQQQSMSWQQFKLWDKEEKEKRQREEFELRKLDQCIRQSQAMQVVQAQMGMRQWTYVVGGFQMLALM